MALTVTTNLESMLVRQNLNSATTALNMSIERMSTGYKINQASDNAAGFSIAEMWKTMISSVDVASDNASTGADLLKTAEDGYDLINAHLQRVRDLTEQAANGTYGTASIRAITAEITARLEEITRISKNTEYNGIKLMSGKDGKAIDLQVGIKNDPNSKINLDGSLFKDANASVLLTKSISDYTANWLTNPSSIVANLDLVDAAIKNISSRVTSIGAAQNRVTSAISALEVQSQNLTSSLSTIRDTDVALESSRYIQAQILQQASATLLSTANQAPSIALNLL